MSNIITSTEAFDDSAVWTPNSTVVTANTHAAPVLFGGSAGMADTLTDSSAVSQGNLVGTYYSGFPVDSSDWVGSIFMRKDAVTTRWPEFVLQFNTGAVGFVSINTSTGATAAGSTAPAAFGAIDFDSLWWRLWMRVANNGTGTDARLIVYPDHLDALGGSGTSAGTGAVVLFGANLTNTSAVQTYEPEPFYSFATVALPWMPVTRVVAGASARVVPSGFTPPSRFN